MGGVRAICGPQTILNDCSALPRLFLARNVTAYSPGLLKLPVIWPVFLSNFKPAGRPLAENSMGRSPVAAMVKRKGEPGRTPKICALLMRGVGGAGGVRMTASS